MEAEYRKSLLDAVIAVKNSAARNLDTAQLSECVYYLSDAIIELLKESKININ